MLRGVVIPAGGAGTRLRSRTGEEIPKALVPVAGKPLIQWNLEVLRDLGVERIWVVTGALHEPFAVLEAYGVERIHHARWERGNGDTLWAGLKRALEDLPEVGVLMSDHLYAPELLEDLVSVEAGENRIWVDPFVEAIFDLPDGMKVSLDPPALSKTLERFDGVDIGMFRLNREILGFFEQASHRETFGIADALGLALQAGTLSVRWVRAPRLWLDVDTPEALEEAERLLRMRPFVRVSNSNPVRSPED